MHGASIKRYAHLQAHDISGDLSYVSSLPLILSPWCHYNPVKYTACTAQIVVAFRILCEAGWQHVRGTTTGGQYQQIQQQTATAVCTRHTDDACSRVPTVWTPDSSSRRKRLPTPTAPQDRGAHTGVLCCPHPAAQLVAGLWLAHQTVQRAAHARTTTPEDGVTATGVCLQVVCASVNPIDWKTRKGEVPRFLVTRPKVCAPKQAFLYLLSLTITTRYAHTARLQHLPYSAAQWAAQQSHRSTQSVH